MSALDRFVGALEAQGHVVKPSAGGFLTTCPAHEDGSPSLGFRQGNKGVVLTCHAGCSGPDVVTALGLRMADLFDERSPAQRNGGGPTVVRRREWDIRDAAGSVVATHVRADLSDGEKRLSWRRGDAWNLGGMPLAALPLYRCEAIPSTSGAVVVTEGEPACDATVARGVDAVGTVTGANGCPGSDALAVLAGRDVVLWPDNDDVGREHMARVAASLAGITASVLYVDWKDAPPKGDAADFTGTDEEFRALVASAVPSLPRPVAASVDPLAAPGARESVSRGNGKARAGNARLRRRPGTLSDTERLTAEPSPDGRPVIKSGVRLDLTVDEAESALAGLDNPRVYTRARGLVVVRREGGDPIRGVRRELGAPFAHDLAAEAVREHLSHAAQWLTFDKRQEDWTPTLPPGPVVAALCKRGAWPGIPPLVGIVEAPTMRPDGSILCQPGYDLATGLLYDPRGVTYPEVPNAPTPDDVKRAVATLRDPFEQFEWEKPDTDVPVVVALMLTFAARPMFEGTSPCFAFDSTTRGSGKGLACEAATIAATGRRPAVSILSPEPEEQRKALFTLALEGHRAVLLDNMTRPLGGGVLSAVLTSGMIRDRVLGGSRSAAAPFDAVLLSTGNNLRFVGDFDRRVLVARQSPTVENPEDREPPGGYRYKDLRAYVTERHPRLLVAALTVLRAFHVAGRPGHKLKSLGSFDSWDGIVRAACLWAGIGDPLACRERIRAEADDDRERIGALLTSWHEAFGSSPATVAEAIEKAKYTPALRLALAAFDTKGDTEKQNALSIGRGLRAVVGRIVGGLRLERATDKSPAPYRVVRPGTPLPAATGPTDPVGLVGMVGIDPSVSNTPRARVSEPAGSNPSNPTIPTETGEPGDADVTSDWWARHGLEDRGEA